tara:strand:- start:1633 stop:2013 length:381 start_codon:yes stop_codon:yes gene_type:complete
MSKKALINISNNAWYKMNNIIKSQNAKGFLFSAVSGGCNGLNYNLELIKDQTQIDKITSEKIKYTKIENNDVKFYIDPLSEMFLIGTNIDWVAEDYSRGIFENKFIFEPDKELATSCGCGISFHPK